MHPEIGLRSKSNRNHQSGEEFSHSITSDCLSRLEDTGETSFSEEVIRDVSGVMFAGEPLSSPRARTRVSHGCSQAQLIQYGGGATVLPITSLINF